jgi:hypothetical protein
MNMVWRWVAVAFGGYVIGIVGWSFTPASRHRNEGVEVLVAFVGSMVAVSGVGVALAYALTDTRPKPNDPPDTH